MNYERFKKAIVSLSLICAFVFSTMVATVVPAKAQGYYYPYQGYYYQVQQPYYRGYYGGYNNVYGYPSGGYGYRVVNPYSYSYGYPYGSYRYNNYYRYN